MSFDQEQNALKITNLYKKFDDTTILNGLSLSLKYGERIALIGSNGSGKSTLLRSTLKLINPDSGKIEILGVDISHLKFRKLKKTRNQVGFVFQKHNLVPRLSALTNVIHATQGKTGGPSSWFQCFASDQTREKALDCLSQVGLGHIAHKQVQTLSGGQSQRVAIARALMQDPKIIFADEPVASLDPEAGTQTMELLSQLAQEKNIALLFTTHHLEHATQYSDKIIGLQKGKIIFEENSTEDITDKLKGFYE